MIQTFIIIGLSWIAIRVAWSLRPQSWKAVSLYQGWIKETQRRGLDDREAGEELSLRMALARVRRVASEQVLQYPHDADNIINTVIRGEAEKIETLDRFKALKFLKWAGALKDTDILYSDALAASRAYLADFTGQPVTPEAAADLVAALTVQR